MAASSRQRRRRETLRAQGLVQTAIFVPARFVPEFRDLARSLHPDTIEIVGMTVRLPNGTLRTVRSHSRRESR